MRDNARDMSQQAAAPGRDPVEGEQHGRGDMQPLRLATNAETGFVHVLDRCGRDAVRTTSAKTWKRAAQSWLIRAMVAVTIGSPTTP